MTNTLHYAALGPEDGPTVVFLHAVGIDGTMWRPLLAHLPGLRAVLIDLPGHGGSRDVPWVSLDQTADQVMEVARAQPGPPHLAALSLGSYVGLHALARHPDAFESALLSGVHAGGMPNRLGMRMVSALVAPLVPRPAMARRTATMFGARTDELGPLVRAAGRTRPSAIRRATAQVIDFAAPQGLGRVRTRCLLMAGAGEHRTILAGLPMLTALLPHASSRIVPGGGHGWLGTHRDVFAHALLRHVSDEDFP